MFKSRNNHIGGISARDKIETVMSYKFRDCHQMSSSMTSSQRRHARRAKQRNTRQSTEMSMSEPNQEMRMSRATNSRRFGEPDDELRNVFLGALRSDLMGKYMTSAHRMAGGTGSVICFADDHGTMRSLVLDQSEDDE
jgi:hypothetical protein